ncbi:hypothetical protein DAPPUDRAFT_105649 [Daphnia pulex]|uniref:Uncharacterized protein n=1 Tax=Daphnia pulex TaxID=6669 RepID=E9GRD3_DAPPU|nr:hypothetical protein DAPPUDRAFT_105649 [Daphnia pulex]|eukprot:EFX78015.1 hypothetical protein DAPPUDRAFT_105649 [Daphnia pulex]
MICKGMSVAMERENKQLRGSRLTVTVSARRAGKFAGEWRVGYSTITNRDEALTTVEEATQRGKKANAETKARQSKNTAPSSVKNQMTHPPYIIGTNILKSVAH